MQHSWYQTKPHKDLQNLHTCWQLLSQGQYPLLMTQPFEGVANIKILPLRLPLMMNVII